jgi:chromosomal replication initiator protein
MLQNQTDSSFWTSLKTDLKGVFPSEIFDMWMDSLEVVRVKDEEIVLGTQNDFAVIWISDNYLDLITKRACQVAGHTVRVVLQRLSDGQETRAPEQVRETSNAGRRFHVPATAPQPPRINPRNTFENFIIGPGNQLAHAACIAVSNEPARAYNPLFLYGQTGLGKTHLMHAVAHHVFTNKPGAKVAYVSCEKFTNEFIKAIHDNTLPKFRKFYRGVDVLLIDDIHFLSNKERIQEEFFHTFNELFESQKQIFLSSDRPASEIAKLEDRLVSRFQWGLVADIQPPDMETRLAILTRKAQTLDLKIPDEILDFIARKVSRNVRSMEGALTRVGGYLALVQKPMDQDTIENLLQDILQEEVQNQITIEKIQTKVAKYFDIRIAEMISKRRPSNIVVPRQIAMYLCRIHTNHSLADIGEQFGGRDHGTVIHACKTVENLREQDEALRRSIDYIAKQLREV